MANYKMYPGSRQKNSKGTFRKSQESVAQKLFKVAKQVIQDVTGYTTGKRVGEKIKQIKAKKQASRAIRTGTNMAKLESTQSYGAKKHSMSKSFSRKPKAVVSTIKPKGIQTTPTPKPTTATMPVSKIAMKTITKGPKPKLKPTSKIKKVKNKETKRKKTQKVKYHKN